MLSFALIAAFAFVATTATTPSDVQFVQHGNCIVDAEIWQLPACAMEQREGNMYLAARYLRLFDFSGPYKLAWSRLPDGGWTYFNRSGRIVIHDVATLDNGPSPVHHGAVRIQRSGKFGIAKLDETVLVPFLYDSLLEPDRHGRWEACIGCRFTHHGDHEMLIEEGSWFWLSSRGHLLSETPHEWGSGR